MVVLDRDGFKLPRVEKEKFILLLRLGLNYDRERGFYSIKNFNNIDKLHDALSEILGTEIRFMQKCSVCGKSLACTECKYVESCSTMKLPSFCVCHKCLRDT